MTGFTRKLQARYTLYLGSPIQRFLICGVLLTALWVDSVVFGVLLVLFVSGLQASLANEAVALRIPPVALLALVSATGLLNDGRFSALVTLGAIISTPILAGIGRTEEQRLSSEIGKILSAWLPLALIAMSLGLLSARDASSAALFLCLIFFHDIGLYVSVRSQSQKRYVPLLAMIGSLALLWTSIQTAATSLPPDGFVPIAIGLALSISAGRVAIALWTSDPPTSICLASSYFLSAPIWTLFVLFLVP